MNDYGQRSQDIAVGILIGAFLMLAILWVTQ